jgi:hypothetical protein
MLRLHARRVHMGWHLLKQSSMWQSAPQVSSTNESFNRAHMMLLEQNVSLQASALPRQWLEGPWLEGLQPGAPCRNVHVVHMRRAVHRTAAWLRVIRCARYGHCIDVIKLAA